MAKPKSKSDDLLGRLQEQMKSSLDAEGIYSVLDYAWEGEDTPADDYLGLAMWCTDAPFEPDRLEWNRTRPPSMPTKQEETFYKAAEDFLGTMELAKNAIGMALYSLQRRKPSNLLDSSETFWEHTAGAALWLNIAADRIREYYIMARFGQTPDEYAAQERRNSFMKPFRAYEANETPKAKQAADDLRGDAKELEQRRNVRNKIVHEVASRQGRNALRSLKRQKEASSEVFFVPRTAAKLLEEAKTWPATFQALELERRGEMEVAIAELKAWYLLAVHSCARAVEYEYWKRKNK